MQWHGKMEFLKKIVPTVASGEVDLDAGSPARETSPRLLKMRRVRLFALGQTIDEDEETHVLHPSYSMYPCYPLGKNNYSAFSSDHDHFAELTNLVIESLFIGVATIMVP